MHNSIEWLRKKLGIHYFASFLLFIFFARFVCRRASPTTETRTLIWLTPVSPLWLSVPGLKGVQSWEIWFIVALMEYNNSERRGPTPHEAIRFGSLRCGTELFWPGAVARKEGTGQKDGRRASWRASHCPNIYINTCNTLLPVLKVPFHKSPWLDVDMMMAAGSGQRRAIGLLGGCGARASVERERV